MPLSRSRFSQPYRSASGSTAWYRLMYSCPVSYWSTTSNMPVPSASRVRTIQSAKRAMAGYSSARNAASGHADSSAVSAPPQSAW